MTDPLICEITKGDGSLCFSLSNTAGEGPVCSKQKAIIILLFRELNNFNQHSQTVYDDTTSSISFSSVMSHDIADF